MTSIEFRIADTFTDSLVRLTVEEQKAVKTTAFDLQLDPSSPGMQFHRIDKSKDKNFWSVRVNRDVRLIVHKTESSLLLCYADHHADAYAWAERRRLEAHPTTGAAQLVEVRETVREIAIPKYVEAEVVAPPRPRLFAHLTDEALLGYGVPPEWLADARRADEDSLLELADHLPFEAAEALLNIATGTMPTPRPRLEDDHPTERETFEHPDAQRRFRTIDNVEELERALEFPWEKWTIFLHPSQQELVEGDYNGPARVSGSAGTGKTIVALHRAVFLARAHPDARVLLTTFSEALANLLRVKLRRLIGNEPRIAERLEVHAMDAIGQRLYERNFGPLRLASRDEVRRFLVEAAEGTRFSPSFLLAEWEQVVDGWQLDSWEEYRDVARLGRKTRLPEPQRAALWEAFAKTRDELQSRGLTTLAAMFTELAAKIAVSKSSPFDFVVVDEAQDVSVAQLRFLAALGGDRPNGLFFAGDLGQRIFQQPFSWKALGVDIRGRSRTLRVNYRTSHQIRSQADLLLGGELADVDGNIELRGGTVSVFNGAVPEVRALLSEDLEAQHVASWLRDRVGAGMSPEEIAIFVRSESEIPRVAAAVEQAGLQPSILDEALAVADGRVSVGTMHLAKGLEFRVVAVMACDDEVIPSQARIETVGDESELEDVYNTERQLLYVACTRARDYLLVTSGGPTSEFLDDLGPPPRLNAPISS